MFERFTERAHQVVLVAQDEARKMSHNYIGTEHILLGLLGEQEGVAARVLGDLGLTTESARGAVLAMIGTGGEKAEGQLPFTPRSKKVLELALREALSFGHNYIGTEHILLALTRENEGVGARVLREWGVSGETIRNAVVLALTRPGGRTAPALVLAPEAVRAALRGNGPLYVRHRGHALRGRLVGYDFEEDRCEVAVSEDGAHGPIDGHFWAHRKDLVLDGPDP